MSVYLSITILSFDKAEFKGGRALLTEKEDAFESDFENIESTFTIFFVDDSEVLSLFEELPLDMCGVVGVGEGGVKCDSK